MAAHRLAGLNQGVARVAADRVERAGRADRQRDEAALDQLQAVIVRADAASPGSSADARQRLVERDDHRGERTGSPGDEQVAIHPLAAGTGLHLDLVLGVAVALDGLELLDRRLFNEGRPGTEALVPRLQDFAAAPLPVGRRLRDGAVGEPQRGAVAAELAGEFGGRLGVGFQLLPKRIARSRLARAQRRQGGEERGTANCADMLRRWT